MDAKALKEMLSEDDIFRLLDYLEGDPRKVNNYITSKTICHGGNSRKLVYYDNKKLFTCMTKCNETFDVMTLIEKVLGYDFWTSIMWLCDFFGIKKDIQVVERNKAHDFLNLFTKQDTIIPELREIDDNILKEAFYEMYYQGWIDEGITIKTMKRFGIMYSIIGNCIVIPHRDMQGRLVGIRKRNLDKIWIDHQGKYMPMWINNELMNHPTKAILYGLYENLEEIKKYKTVIIFEAEKSVMQLASFEGFPSIGVAVCGSSFSDIQVEILKSIGVENIIFAFDKEFEEVGSVDEEIQIEKINVFIAKTHLFFNVSIIHDKSNLLALKNSPTDRGETIFLKLFEERIMI